MAGENAFQRVARIDDAERREHVGFQHLIEVYTGGEQRLADCRLGEAQRLAGGGRGLDRRSGCVLDRAEIPRQFGPARLHRVLRILGQIDLVLGEIVLGEIAENACETEERRGIAAVERGEIDIGAEQVERVGEIVEGLDEFGISCPRGRAPCPAN